MADIIFTLGKCNQNGDDFRFDYNNGYYKIIKVVDEDETVLETIKDSTVAYAKWNQIKRPEKFKKL